MRKDSRMCNHCIVLTGNINTAGTVHGKNEDVDDDYKNVPHFRWFTVNVPYNGVNHREYLFYSLFLGFI